MWLQTSKLIALVLGVIALLVLPALFMPSIPPQGVQITADTEFVATQPQLEQGIDMQYPYISGSQMPVTITVMAIEPFVVTPTLQINMPSGSTFRSTLSIPSGSTATVGSYLGSVAAMSDKTYKTQVKVTIEPGWPLIVVLIGLLFSHFTTLWATRYKPGNKLNSDRLALLSEVKRDASSSSELNPGIYTLISELLGGTTEYSPTSVRGLISAGQIKEAESKLTETRMLYDKYQIYIDQLRRLKEARADMQAKRDELGLTTTASPPNQITEIEAAINKLLSEGPIEDVKSLTRRGTEAEALLTLCERFIAAFGRYRICCKIISTLQPTPDWKRVDEMTFINTRAALPGLRNDLWIVKTLADFNVWQMESRIEESYFTLSMLSEKYSGSLAVPTVEAGSPGGWLQTEVLNILIGVDNVRSAIMTATSFSARSAVPVTPEQLEKDAKRLREFTQAFDFVLLSIGWIVAAVTAMSILYVGKPFGMPIDYVIAFLWGSGVDQTVKGLASVMANISKPVVP